MHSKFNVGRKEKRGRCVSRTSHRVAPNGASHRLLPPRITASGFSSSEVFAVRKVLGLLLPNLNIFDSDQSYLLANAKSAASTMTEAIADV